MYYDTSVSEGGFRKFLGEDHKSETHPEHCLTLHVLSLSQDELYKIRS